MNNTSANHCYIAGDWGTSCLRLSLVDSTTGKILDETSGPGIGTIKRNEIPQILSNATKDWQQNQPLSQVLFCGMVGSSIGWADAGYLDCPVSPKKLSESLCHQIIGDFAVNIVPGISCKSPTCAPDVMRGEETQVLGAILLEPRLTKGKHLLCLPGTHSKWVWLEDSVVKYFFTSLSGELFDLLQQYSVLLRGSQPKIKDNTAFAAGVARSKDNPRIDLLHLLFETRSRQLNGELTPTDATSFLSGLIIGRDILSAMQIHKSGKESPPPAIHFIGNQRLNHLYQLAAQHMELNAFQLNGNQLVRTGIHHIYKTFNQAYPGVAQA